MILLLLETELLLLSSSSIHVDLVVLHKDIRSRTHTVGGVGSNITPNQSPLYGTGLGTALNASQNVLYGTNVPLSGDILLKGSQVGRTGSLGWIYASFFQTVPAANILNFTMNGSTVITSTGVTTYPTNRLVLHLVRRLESRTSVIMHSMVSGRLFLLDSLILQPLVRLQSLRTEVMLTMKTQDFGQLKLQSANGVSMSSLTLHGRKLVFLVLKHSELRLTLLVITNLESILLQDLHTMHIKMHLLILQLILVQTLTLLVQRSSVVRLSLIT